MVMTVVMWLLFSCVVLGPIAGWQAVRAGRRPWPWVVAGGLVPVVGVLTVIALPVRTLPTAAQLHASPWPTLGMYMLSALLCILILLAVFYAFLAQAFAAF